MLQKKLFQKALLGVLLVFVSANVFANSEFNTCPTIEMLKSFNEKPLIDKYITISPLSFDIQSKTVKLSFSQRKKFQIPSKNAAFSTPPDKNMSLVISPITLAEGEDPQKTAAMLLDNMQIDFDMPYIEHHGNDVHLALCSYSLPGSEVKALVYVFLPE